MRIEFIIEKLRVATRSHLLLEGQRDQVSEPALGQRILVGKQTVVRMKPDLRTPLHRFRKNMRTEFARQTGGNGLVKEKPNMTAVAGARAFQNGGHFDPPTGFEKGRRIRLPVLVVKVRRQKETGLVLQHGIDPHHKILTTRVTTRKMPADHFIRDWKKAALKTIRAFDARLLTDTGNPFIGAGGRITGLPGFPALETAGINVFPAPEKRSKQRDLGGGRGLIGDRRV